MNLRDMAERLFWTVVAAAGGSLVAAPVLGITAWQAAGITALTAAINFVTIVARTRLAVLPDPGAGLPKLPTDDRGAVGLVEVGVFLVLVALAALILTRAGWL